MPILLVFTILVIGASGIIAQLLLVRELLVCFYGNEFTIGLVLASWLITEALGSYLIGKIVHKPKRQFIAFNILLTIFSIALPTSVYLARIAKNIVGVAPGEILSVPIMFLISIVILLPLGFTHGALFTLSCSLLAQLKEKAVGRVYVLETIGTIIGGVITPYLLIPNFITFDITFIIIVAMFFLLFIINSYPQVTALLNDKTMKSSKKTVCFGWAGLPFGVAVILLLLSLAKQIPIELHNLALAHQWQGYNVVYSENSKYGNITVIKQAEQYTFYEDGIPVVNVPIPDIAFAEDFIHFPFLTHSAPKKVLIISGAVGGILQEMFKHPVEEIIYVELDPLLLTAIKKFPTPLTTQELTDRRVRLIHQDARFYLTRSKEKYDLIFINILAPQTLQSNRFFTKEFFAEAKKRLNPNGILVTQSYGSLSYIGAELRHIIRTHWQTLHSVFPNVFVIPGDFTLFLATAEPIDITPQRLIERLQDRKIKTNLITPEYIQDRLSEYRTRWFWESLRLDSNDKVKFNSDFAHYAVFYNLIYWSSRTSTIYPKFFTAFQSITIFHFLLIFTLILIIGLYLTRRLGKYKVAMPFALFSTGFVGMVLNLVVALSFQAVFGYIYHQISILITAFIVGTALGGGISTKYGDKLRKKVATFLLLELLLVLISLIIPILVILNYLELLNDLFAVSSWLFVAFSLLIGVLLGMEFPLANMIHSTSDKITQQVGLLYASDLGGGFIGALLVSVILIPVLGIIQTCLVAALFKLTSCFLILFSQKQLQNPKI